MKETNLKNLAATHLKTFCEEIKERCVGSQGNRDATNYFKKEISKSGWEIEEQIFNAIDWEYGDVNLKIDKTNFKAFVSPYSLGCDTMGELISISNLNELKYTSIKNKIILLNNEITKEQLMPKNFVFYNPIEHQEIIKLLEKGNPNAIICATGRNAALAGGVYPFPLIEDGDFNIPSVYMTEKEGKKLLPFAGKTTFLKSFSKRIPGKGYNIIAKKGNKKGKSIVITAHIDAKKGTPGAIDNATGVVILLLLAELLNNYCNDYLIEIVAFNGEDYFSVPGQMTYIKNKKNNFSNILLNINIDGAGYKDGKSAFSFYDLPDNINTNIKKVLNKFSDIIEGVKWVQGDHSIFIQNSCPAIAVSSEWFTKNVDNQDVTHTPKDNLKIVNSLKLIDIAHALKEFIINI